MKLKFLGFVFLLGCLFPAPAHAVREVKTLSSKTNQTTSFTSEKVCTPSNAHAFSFSQVAVYDSGTSTLDAKVQITIDEGTTWIDLSDAAFTQVTTSSANEVMHISDTVKNLSSFACFRIVTTLAGGSPQYDWTIRVHYTRP